MAKEKYQKSEERMEQKQEMTLEEAKAYRASLYKPEARVLSEQERREKFRVFWAQQKRQYGQGKDIEQIIWLHLQATKMDSPEKFAAGLTHFGLKKNR